MSEWFDKFSELFSAEGPHSPNVKLMADEMLKPIIEKARLQIAVDFYKAGREADLPESLRNETLREVFSKDGSRIGFTANIKE